MPKNSKHTSFPRYNQPGSTRLGQSTNFCDEQSDLFVLMNENQCTETVILGDPGADKVGEGKSKRAEKYIRNEEK